VGLDWSLGWNEDRRETNLQGQVEDVLLGNEENPFERKTFFENFRTVECGNQKSREKILGPWKLFELCGRKAVALPSLAC
jgi:hypothetical protein